MALLKGDLMKLEAGLTPERSGGAGGRPGSGGGGGCS